MFPFLDFVGLRMMGGGGDAVSQKRCRLFSLCNLKKLQLIIIFFAHCILKVLASKCMHYFPSRLSCGLTLPRNTLTIEYA